MTAYPGTPRWMGLGIETERGTAVTPSIYVPYESFDATQNAEEYSPIEHTGSLNTRRSIIRPYNDSNINIKVDAFPEMILEHALYAALGSKSSAQQGATAAYLHTFTEDSDSRPTFTIMANMTTDDATIVPEEFASCMLNKFSFSTKEKEGAKLDLDFIGYGVNLDTTDQTESYATDPLPFTFNQMKFEREEYGTTPSSLVEDARITEFGIDIETGVVAQQVNNQSTSPGEMIHTKMDVSGNITFVFEDLTDYKKWLGGASATEMGTSPYYENVKLTFTGANIASTYDYQLIFYLPKVYFREYKRDEL